MMSLVRAQQGEPKRKRSPKGLRFCFDFSLLILEQQYCGCHSRALPTERSEVVASKKQSMTVFYAAKPPKARSRRTQAVPATRGDYATVERRAHDCKYARTASDSIHHFVMIPYKACALIPYRRQAADSIHAYGVILHFAQTGSFTLDLSGMK